jgi:excisionase family DNA binding protein
MASSHARKLDRPVGAESPVAPQEDQHAELAELSRMLAGHARSARSRAKRLRVVGPNGETLALPASVVEVLERATAVLSNGDAVSILPVGRELTTQQAANLLNVSRQYVVRLVNEDRLPCTRTGKHRRLRMEDVLAFKRARDLERRRALTDLTRLTEEFGGYDREMK